MKKNKFLKYDINNKKKVRLYKQKNYYQIVKDDNKNKSNQLTLEDKV
jgi:hypothetical protein